MTELEQEWEEWNTRFHDLETRTAWIEGALVEVVKKLWPDNFPARGEATAAPLIAPMAASGGDLGLRYRFGVLYLIGESK